MPRTKQFCEKEIVDKAMELFWEKGFHATSIQDLVSHLGINRASLYDTFGGKETLFNTVFSHYKKTTYNWLAQHFEVESRVKEGFQKLFEQAIDIMVNDKVKKGCFVVNTTTELVPGDEKIQHILSEHSKKIETLFSQQVKKGINSGELSSSKNAQEIGLMLFALYNGISVLGKMDPNPQRLRKVVGSALSVLD